jgi:hypothetical protein
MKNEPPPGYCLYLIPFPDSPFESIGDFDAALFHGQQNAAAVMRLMADILYQKQAGAIMYPPGFEDLGGEGGHRF